jgi:hypothetical protein
VIDQQLLLDPNVGAAELGPCIEACEHCHRTCLRAAMQFCLEQGGRHVEAPYFRLLIACETVCRLTADSLLAGLPLYEHVCGVCARFCRDCAAACDEAGDMEECSEACAKCAQYCELIAATRLEPQPALPPVARPRRPRTPSRPKRRRR